QAPISAAFIISAGLEHHSRIKGLQAGGSRMAEELFGCVIGLVVGWFVSVIWPRPEPEPVPVSNAPKYRSVAARHFDSDVADDTGGWPETGVEEIGRKQRTETPL